MKLQCPRCKTVARGVSAEKAARWYHKLRPYLGVVPPWGCYVPKRRGAAHSGHDHADWPLHSWRGPGASPLVLGWGRDGRAPTFAEFCSVYGLDPRAEP